MVDLTGAIGQMVKLLVVVVLGFAAAKLGYLDRGMSSRLTKLLLNITMPCMILASIDGLDASEAGAQVPLAFALAFLMFALLLATGLLCTTVLRVPATQVREYLFMSACPNTGFIGLTVLSALYGSESLLFGSIFTMVHSFLISTVALLIIAPEEEGGAKGHAPKIQWKTVASPLTVACVLSIALFFAQVELPGLAVETLDMVGGITSPLALMLVGVMMADVDFKSVLSEVRLYPYILIRQLIVPVALYALLSLAVDDTLLVGVFTIMFAMPVGTMVSLFVEQSGRDAELAAKGTILSTAASFAAIPGLVTVMSLI